MFSLLREQRLEVSCTRASSALQVVQCGCSSGDEGKEWFKDES